MRIFTATIASAIAAFVACDASAQTAAPKPDAYPTKPVRMIVVNPPGSGVDIVARLVGPKMGEVLKQQIVVDNRAGASGIIGVDLAAKSVPDGYTLLMGSSSSQVINACIYTNLPYDPVKDLAPITMLASTPYLMVAHPSLAAKSVAEVIAAAKAQPGKLNYATGGLAVASTLAGELFKSMAGVNIVMVPYKGTPQATSDVVAGQVQLAFSTMPAGLPLVKAGRLRALGITSAKRLSTTPDIPTIAESGLPGYEITTWFGILAPRATPRPIISRVQREAIIAINQPDVNEKLVGQGYEVVGTTPEQFATFIETEIAKFTRIVKIAGIPQLSAGE